MKKLFLKDLFSYIFIVHKKAAILTLPVFCLLAYPAARLYLHLFGYVYVPESVGFVAYFLAVLLVIQLVLSSVYTVQFIVSNEDLSEFDKSLLSGKFRGPAVRTLIYHSLSEINDKHDYQSALNDLKALEDTELSEIEQGVVGFYSAVCYTGLGYPVHAANSAVRAVKAGVAEPESLMLAARGYAGAGNYEQSRECYDVLCDIAAESFSFPTAFCEAGDVCLKSGKGEDAYRFFHRSLEYGLSVAAAQGGLALACILKGNIDEAVGWYRLALLSRIPDPDDYRIVCEQVCRASGLAPDVLDKALRESVER